MSVLDPTDPLPLYYQLYIALLERIRSGEFAPGAMLPSERKLGEDYGVSRITVIKAMDLLKREGLIERRRGRGSFVLPKPQGKPPAQCERVAFCLPTFADSYITSILMGATRVAMRHGVQLQVIGVESEESESEHIRQVVGRGASGVLVFPRARHPDRSLYRHLLARHYPLVLLDRYYPDLDTDRVVFDDESAAYELTKILVERGHRRIAVFPGHEITVSSVKNRLRGYRRALREHHLDYDEDLVCLDVYENLSPVSVNQLRYSYRRLLNYMRKLRFTGVVAINMYVASQMMMDFMKIKNSLLQASVARRTGKDIGQAMPEIVAIASRLFVHDRSSLMAVALQSGKHLGEQGMLTLLTRLREGGEKLSRQELKIPMQIVNLDDDHLPCPEFSLAENISLGTPGA